MRQIYIRKITMKSKIINFFSKEMFVMKMKKMHQHQLNLRNFMRTQKLKTMIKQLFKVFKVIYNEFKKI